MKRLLCIVSSMSTGGAETFLMKLYRSIDKEKYQFDFIVSKKEKGFYDDEITKLGGKIYYVPPKSKHPLKSFLEIKRIVHDNKYLSVLRTSQQSLANIDLIAAYCGGARKLIYRASNASITGNGLKKLINRMFRFLNIIVPNVKIAPSTLAAQYVFGNRCVNKGKVHIIHNAINYDKFAFNNDIRKQIRKELHVTNKNVYGHVGRFNIQKNHKFLIEVFNEIQKKDSKAVLILIGEGELKDSILEYTKKLGIENKVKFLGVKENVNEYLMAMDKLIFPSFFEGMPNVLIESEASALPSYVSDTITKEAKITKYVKYISLDKTSKEWADIIIRSNIKRSDTREPFIKNNYMIEDVLDEFIKISF